jgi:polysaccharide export outer membrane protein
MAKNRLSSSRGLLLLLGIALQPALMTLPGDAQTAQGTSAGQTTFGGASLGKAEAASGVSALTVLPKDFSELRVLPGDLLSVNVYDTPEISDTYRVDPAGNLSLPLCGKVQVRGLTLPEVASLLEATLKNGQILVNPQVTVDVRQYAAQYVTVSGEVASPGRVELISPTKLSEVLVQAGGLTAAAGAHIKIRRGADEAAAEEDVPYLRSKSNEAMGAVLVRPGDTVFVPRAGIVYVLGAVNRPGGYVMQEDGQLNVAEALAMSGGTVMQANTAGLRVIRRNADGTVLDFPLSYDAIAKGTQAPLLLQPQDIVYVPMSKIKAILSDTTGIVSSAASAAIINTGR